MRRKEARWEGRGGLIVLLYGEMKKLLESEWEEGGEGEGKGTGMGMGFDLIWNDLTWLSNDEWVSYFLFSSLLTHPNHPSI